MVEDRSAIIVELQKLAENVLNLKQNHRQKRPIVIEFSGSPKAGKTSCINSLELFLKRNGFSVKVIQERASICPVSDKQSPMFNLWTACMSLAGLIGTLEDKKNDVDVLILDRGIFDALCWFKWLVSNLKMEEKQREIIEKFLLMEELVKSIDIVFAFCVQPEISIDREYANLLTDKPGRIMNKKVLAEYLTAIENTVSEKKEYFHNVFLIDSTNKNQDQVGKEVTERTLSTLKDLLMERIGYFVQNREIKGVLAQKNVYQYEELREILQDVKFDMRDVVEDNNEFIQPIPIAIISNKQKNKVLVIKKNKNAVSNNSPEKDKILLYIGGHTRMEDLIGDNSKDFLALCRSTLKREIKEEIGISLALNEIEPFMIYSKDNPKSKLHLAVCFFVLLDDEGVKLRLDPQELVQNKGKSKSGRFMSIEEICNETELESWSKTILDVCFGVSLEQNYQISIFECGNVN